MEKNISNLYSKKALEALAKMLKQHRSLVWINPVTNAIDVKRVFDRAEGVQPPSEVTFA